MVKIKFCGLRREEDIEYVNKLKPDYAGFILSDGFKRSVPTATAKKLIAMLDKDIKAVGVFVNDDIEKINSLVREGVIDTVQLHGSETPEYCRQIEADVIKSLETHSFDKSEEYDTAFLLFDSGKGSGKVFDWSEIPQTNKPFFLAGGINKDNISDAVSKVGAYCIDLSSAVETNGVKDYNKMKEIMDCINRN